MSVKLRMCIAYLTKKPRATNGFLDEVIPPEWAIRRETSGHGMDIFFDAASDIWALGLLVCDTSS